MKRKPRCIIDGCEKPAKTYSAIYCQMHYFRWYRHGNPHRVATRSGITTAKERRYKLAEAPDHPLAYEKSGKIWEHRRVLYDSIGPGVHQCHWCQKPVRWDGEQGKDQLEVAHLNGDGGDNRITNLVPSCRGCNSSRAHQERSEKLRLAGWWSKNDTIAELSGKNARRDPIETRT